jgi:ribonuclease M5
MTEQKLLNIPYTIIVEGKYDRLKLLTVCNAHIVTTDGFGVFKSREKLSLIKKLSEARPIIMLTDSDGAGKLIRSHITSAIPQNRLIQLYIPQVEGKERRKEAPSAEGFLGVEGTDAELIRKLLEPFAVGVSSEESEREEITKADFFEAGLTGGSDSAEKRDKFAVSVGLPKKMTPNALLAAVNVIMTREEFFETARDFMT